MQRGRPDYARRFFPRAAIGYAAATAELAAAAARLATGGALLTVSVSGRKTTRP